MKGSVTVAPSVTSSPVSVPSRGIDSERFERRNGVADCLGEFQSPRGESIVKVYQAAVNEPTAYTFQSPRGESIVKDADVVQATTPFLDVLVPSRGIDRESCL